MGGLGNRSNSEENRRGTSRDLLTLLDSTSTMGRVAMNAFTGGGNGPEPSICEYSTAAGSGVRPWRVRDHKTIGVALLIQSKISKSLHGNSCELEFSWNFRAGAAIPHRIGSGCRGGSHRRLASPAGSAMKRRIQQKKRYADWLSLSSHGRDEAKSGFFPPSPGTTAVWTAASPKSRRTGMIPPLLTHPIKGYEPIRFFFFFFFFFFLQTQTQISSPIPTPALLARHSKLS